MQTNCSFRNSNITKYRPSCWAALFLIALLAASCSRLESYRLHLYAAFDGTLRFQPHIANLINQDTPIPVDLVIITDDKLIHQLLNMSAKEWFSKKEQLKLDFPQDVHFWSWEWEPGQIVPLASVPLIPNAQAGFVFANYQQPGPHRYRIDPFLDFVLNLNEDEFDVELMK